jgi:hypothetical protein
MKKIVLAVSVLMLMVLPVWVLAETLTWTNPTQYTDGSAISPEDQAKLKTHIYWSTKSDSGWVEFAVVENGANTWAGQLPANRGVTAYYTLRSELNGLLSDYMSPSVSYVRPFIPTKAPSGLTISP